MITALQPQRRAQPPRPTLMVGDERACLSALGDLKSDVAALAAGAAPGVAPGGAEDRSEAARAPWRAFLRRLRALRESLVSIRARGGWAVEAFELSVDVCARAGEWGELLKAQQHLLSELYVDGGSVEGGSTGGDGGGCCARLEEMHATAVLYFACVAGDAAEFGSALRRAGTAGGVGDSQVAWAAQVGALALRARGPGGCCEYVLFWRLLTAAPTPLLARVAAASAGVVAAAAVRCAAAAYHKLPSDFAAEALAGGTADDLDAAIAAAVAAGAAGAKVAARERAERGASSMLYFKEAVIPKTAAVGVVAAAR